MEKKIVWSCCKYFQSCYKFFPKFVCIQWCQRTVRPISCRINTMELLLDTRLCCQPAIPGDIIQFLISIFLYIYLHLKSTIFIPTTPNPGLVAWQLDHSLHYSTKIKCFVLYFVPGIIPSFNNIISVLPSSPLLYTKVEWDKRLYWGAL